MLKLYSGPAWPSGKVNSVSNLGCKACYNWDFPTKLEAAFNAGLDVWPMAHNASGSVERFIAWCAQHPVSHVMLENEPFTQKGMTPEQTAHWLLNVPRIPGSRRVLGGFLLTYPQTYAEIRPKVRAFANAWPLFSDDVMAFHPYLPSAPSMEQVPYAADWFAAQIGMIASDWPLYAITEWGVPNGRVSYSGRDVPALTEYMKRGWAVMMERACYASAWFMGGPNNQFSEWNDSILCKQNGEAKPLGVVYRDLPEAIEPEEPSAPPVEGWTTHNVSTWAHSGRLWEATVRSKSLTEAK
jgi:hypothetical protein